MKTKKECQSIIFKIGIELGISPKLIAERLLSAEDKDDMMNGLLTVDALKTHITIWIENGMPDYVQGVFEPYYKRPENMRKFAYKR